MLIERSIIRGRMSAVLLGMGSQTYYSIQHIQSAAYFAKQTARLQRRALNNPLNPSLKVHVQSNFAATIFTSVAFLEALLNELWADCEQQDGGHLKDLPQDARHKIVDALQRAEKSAITQKYKALLKAADKPQIPCGNRPLQDMKHLVDIRNNMVHYNAAWLDTGTPGMCRPGYLEETELGAFIGRHLAHTPGLGWMNSANAEWAVRLVLLYAEAAAENLGITSLHDHIRSELQPFTTPQPR
ncbi:hypothetical protein [Pseudomonas sp. NPDC079086]|uniref:hypothetical protein n=1 Tax=Pseudomonas sp. NPDC079086 TaxID=3364427 RepID=UPI0037CB152C